MAHCKAGGTIRWARTPSLYPGNHDTLYRIHGTNEPPKSDRPYRPPAYRMRDMDVIDLYKRVHIGTPVVVR